MSKLTLLMGPGLEATEGDVALWEGRDEKGKAFSLENLLDQRLLQIRKEHMQWAYDIGMLKVGDKNLQAALECGDTPSQWWASLIYERHPKLSPQLYPIYKLRTLELLLDEKGYNELCLVGGPHRIRKILETLCAAKGVRFRFKKGPYSHAYESKSRLGRLYSLIPAPLQALIRLAHWQWTIKRKLPPVNKLPALSIDGSSQKPSATIATYFPNIDLHAAGEGRFRSRYWESLHEAINKEAHRERPKGPHFVRWLLIRFPSPDLDFTECIRLRDLFQKEGRDGLSFSFLEEFISAADIRASLARWVKLSLQSLRLRNKFAANCVTSGSNLNFWPFMRSQWYESLAGWRSLERCLFNCAFKRYSKIAGPQRWTLFPLENCPWERMLTNASRQIKNNGQVYGAQHSTIRPTDFRYFDAPETFITPECAIFQPDVIAGNGASACDQWHRNEMPPRRLKQVEALRYLYLAETKAAMEQQDSDIPPQAGEPLEPCKGKKLLILTSFFADETTAHLRLVKDAMGKGYLDDFQLVLKPHPYLMPDDWLESLPEKQKERIFVSHSPLSLELTPGTSVWASNSTTAALEAAIKGLPIMVMAPYKDFDLCPIQDVPGLLRTATSSDVKTCLAHLKPLQLESDYLDLNPDLSAWRKLLALMG